MPSMATRPTRSRKRKEVDPKELAEVVKLLKAADSDSVVMLDTEHLTEGKARSEAARYRAAITDFPVRATAYENDNGTFTGGIYRAA